MLRWTLGDSRRGHWPSGGQGGLLEEAHPVGTCRCTGFACTSVKCTLDIGEDVLGLLSCSVL